MKRREFIVGLSAAAWPIIGRAQQSAMPVIGFLTTALPDTAYFREVSAAFCGGLSETGRVEGQNVAIEYRAGELRLERLPALAADLVRRQVAVIVATPAPAVFAASQATRSIPIVFLLGVDPVETGVVASLSRPGGNLTGASILMSAVVAKRLELLHELVPAANHIGHLVDPRTTAIVDAEKRELQAAARVLGLRVVTLTASHESEFEAAFATLAREGVGGLVVGSHTLFFSNFDRLAALAARHQVPTIYQSREATSAGGLMAYGTDLSVAYHQIGTYAGRILNGETPRDLPVQQVTKMQLAINIKAAKALGLTFPTALLVRADEVIE